MCFCCFRVIRMANAIKEICCLFIPAYPDGKRYKTNVLFVIPAYPDGKRNKTNAVWFIPAYPDGKRNKTNVALY